MLALVAAFYAPTGARIEKSAETTIADYEQLDLDQAERKHTAPRKS